MDPFDEVWFSSAAPTDANQITTAIGVPWRWRVPGRRSDNDLSQSGFGGVTAAHALCTRKARTNVAVCTKEKFGSENGVLRIRSEATVAKRKAKHGITMPIARAAFLPRGEQASNVGN